MTFDSALYVGMGLALLVCLGGGAYSCASCSGDGNTQTIRYRECAEPGPVIYARGFTVIQACNRYRTVVAKHECKEGWWR